MCTLLQVCLENFFSSIFFKILIPNLMESLFILGDFDGDMIFCFVIYRYYSLTNDESPTEFVYSSLILRQIMHFI